MSFGNSFEQTVRLLCEQSDPFARVNRAIADHGFGGTVGLDTSSGRIVWSGITLPDGSPEDDTPLPGPLAAAEEFVLKALHEYEEDEQEAEAGGEDLDTGEAFEDAVEDAAEDMGLDPEMVDVDEDAFDLTDPDDLPSPVDDGFGTDEGFGEDEFHETDPLSAASDDYGAGVDPVGTDDLDLFGYTDQPINQDYYDGGTIDVEGDTTVAPQDEPMDLGVDEYALDPLAGQDGPVDGGMGQDLGPVPDYDTDLEAPGVNLDLPGDGADLVLNPDDPFAQVDADPDYTPDEEWLDASLDGLEDDPDDYLNDYGPRFEAACPLREARFSELGSRTVEAFMYAGGWERYVSSQTGQVFMTKGRTTVIVTDRSGEVFIGTAAGRDLTELKQALAELAPFITVGKTIKQKNPRGFSKFFVPVLSVNFARQSEAARPLREFATGGLTPDQERRLAAQKQSLDDPKFAKGDRVVIVNNMAKHGSEGVVLKQVSEFEYLVALPFGAQGRFHASELLAESSHYSRSESVHCKGDPSLLSESERWELGMKN